MTLALLVFTLAILAAALVLARVAVEVRVWQSSVTSGHATLGALAIVVANAPLFSLSPLLFGASPILPADARSHAIVARSIARGVPHAWTDALQAGFPLGPHYPSLGSGLDALLITLGLSPAIATQTLGVACLLAAPLAVYALALRNGASLFAALAGALVLSWVAPFNSFVGGYGAYLSLGLVSQVLCVAILPFVAAGIFGRGSPWRATVPAVVAMAAHPQIATSCLLVLGVPAIATWDRRIGDRFARATLAAGIVGAAVYGPGLATLHVPFGWPPMSSWKLTGFGFEHLAWHLGDGELLDLDRKPVLTTLWAAASLVLFLRAGRPAARAALAASAMTLVLSGSGEALHRMGSAGARFLSFVQPLRVISLVPLAAATTVLVAIEESAPFARRLLEHARLARAPWVPIALRGAALTVFAAMVFPSQLTWARTMRASIEGAREGGACGPSTPPGFDEARVKSWLGALEGGRLTFEDTEEAPLACAMSTGFELASHVPVAVTFAVGAHVGVHTIAFHALHPEREGGGARAEALGVRYALAMVHDPVGADWEEKERSGKVALFERRLGTDTVGVGCVTSVWRGSDAALRARLLADLQTTRGADRLLDPTSLVALETTGDASVKEAALPSDGCSADGAVVHEIAREPGAYEATVRATAPVDVVFRATAFPAWRVLVDGAPVPVRTTAPGFFAVRVAAGGHDVTAVVGPPAHYVLGILIALALACAASITWQSGRGRAYLS